MNTETFIVVETKNGRATPSSVWEASSEQDYMARVAASNPRSGEEFDDFAQVIARDEERHAMSVLIIRRDDFNGCFPESIDDRILGAAERLGWYARPDQNDE